MDLRAPSVVPSAPNIRRVLGAWAYDGPARDLVLGLKLRSLAYAADALADGLWRRVTHDGTAARLVTWVPARPADVRARGFDHARLIAVGLAARCGLPCRPVLKRVGRQIDQAGLTREERVANLRGAFEATSIDVPALVVDDLVTTGATISACGRALRAAGAPLVEAAVACVAE